MRAGSGDARGPDIHDDRASRDVALAGDDVAVARGMWLAVKFGEASEIHVVDHDRIETRRYEVADPEAWPRQAFRARRITVGAVDRPVRPRPLVGVYRRGRQCIVPCRTPFTGVPSVPAMVHSTE